MLCVVLSLAIASATPTPLAYRARVEVADAVVTLADVAELSGLPSDIRERAGRLEVARMPRGGVADLSASRLSERARAQLPALGAWLPPEVEGRVTVVRKAAEPSRPMVQARPCARLRNAVVGGDFVSSDDLEPAACQGRPARAFGLDRSTGLARAAVALPVGQVVTAPPPASLARFKPGQPFMMSAAVGVVRIERPVVAARPARVGRDVVVHDSEGRVHLAPSPAEAAP
jgi:hypothetical protein